LRDRRKQRNTIPKRIAIPPIAPTTAPAIVPPETLWLFDDAGTVGTIGDEVVVEVEELEEVEEVVNDEAVVVVVNEDKDVEPKNIREMTLKLGLRHSSYWQLHLPVLFCTQSKRRFHHTRRRGHQRPHHRHLKLLSQ